MKTIDEYNREFLNSQRNVNDDGVNAGVACTKCGKEMTYAKDNIVMCSLPPQISVECSCGYHATKFFHG